MKKKIYYKSAKFIKDKEDFSIMCNIIKSEVEDAAGIRNLGVYSRKAYIRDCRFSYFKICEELSDGYFSLQIVADVVNRISHATVLNGLEEFKYQYGTELFKANDVYKEALASSIQEIQIDNKKLLKKIKKLQSNEEFLISQMEVIYQVA